MKEAIPHQWLTKAVDTYRQGLMRTRAFQHVPKIGLIADIIAQRLRDVVEQYQDLASGSTGGTNSMDDLCKMLGAAQQNLINVVLPEALATQGATFGERERLQLDRWLNESRGKVRRRMEEKAGWDDVQDKIDRGRAFLGFGLGPEPLEPSWDDFLEGIPVEQVNVLRHMIEQLKMPKQLVVQILRAIYPGVYTGDDQETEDKLDFQLGVCEVNRPPLMMAEMPPDLFYRSDLAHVRPLLFPFVIDHYFTFYRSGGLPAVRAHLVEERASIAAYESAGIQRAAEEAQIAREVHAAAGVRRAFTNVVERYFEGYEAFTLPDSLRKEIKGKPFPSEEQQRAIYEQVHFAGRLFDGRAMGRGKTGVQVAVATILLERGLIKKAAFVVPASLMGEWSRAFSDDEEDGYFAPGRSPSITIIGRKKDRPKKFRQARRTPISLMSYQTLIKSTPSEQMWEMLLGTANTVAELLDVVEPRLALFVRSTLTQKNEALLHQNLTADVRTEIAQLLAREEQRILIRKPEDIDKKKNPEKRKRMRTEENSDVVSNASWVASLLQPDSIGMDESQLAKNAERGKRNSIAANLHLLSRRCRYRIASSATVIEHDLDDLIRAEQYMCAEEPAAASANYGAPTFFDQHLYSNADSSDQAALTFLLQPPKNRFDFNDLRFLREKINEGIAPFEFRSTYFDPPYEKSPEDAERALRFERVVVPYTPRELALVEDVIASIMTVNQKRDLIRDIGDIPNALPGYADTGRAKFEFACQCFDRWFFQENADCALYVSPHRAAGVTRADAAHPVTILDLLKSRYEPQGISVIPLHGGISEHIPRLQADNTLQTETQRIIDDFLRKKPSILVVTLPIINFGINQLAKGGVAHAFVAGATRNRTLLDQMMGRLDRPGQWKKIIEIIQALSPGYDQAVAHKGDVLKTKGAVFLNGRKSTAADEFWLRPTSDNQRFIGQDYLSLQVTTDRQKFARLSQLLQEQGQDFIDAGLDELYAELYNKNFLEFKNANFLRAVAAIVIDHLIPQVLAKKRAAGLSEKIDIIDCASGSWGLKRIMADYLRKNGNVRISSRDLSKAMLSSKIGSAILQDLYEPNLDKICSIDNLCYDASASQDITVTALGKDVLDHGEEPPRRGRQRIISYVEDSRVAREFAVHTFPDSVFRDAAKLEKYLEAMSYFGWEVIDTLTGTYKSVKSADAPEQCSVHIVVMRKREGQDSTVQFDPFGPWQNIPLAVREGLDFTHTTHREATVRSGPRRRGPKGPPPDEKRSYATAFTAERNGKRVAKVEFKAPRVQEDKKKFREKSKLLEECSPPVRVVLMSYPSLGDIPAHSWSSQQLDDIMTSHKEVRKTYAQALITRYGNALEQEVPRINASQNQGMLKILDDSQHGKMLVCCDRSGKPLKGESYPISMAG